MPDAFARPTSRPWVVLLGLLSSASGCNAPGDPVESSPGSAEVRAIESMLDELYTSFCFDAGGEADWTRMRALIAPGATFVSPIPDGGSAAGVDVERFVADFRDWCRTGAYRETGLHERITHARIDRFGNVAHAYVTFEGFVPGEDEPRTLGLDSIQLVRDAGDWKLISFTSQYTSEARTMPERFTRERDAWTDAGSAR